MLDRITVHGARQHNLKNIDVAIPRNSFTVVTVTEIYDYLRVLYSSSKRSLSRTANAS